MELEFTELKQNCYILRLTSEVLSCDASEIIGKMQQFLLRKPKGIVLSVLESAPDKSVISGLIILLQSVLKRQNVSLSIIEKSGYYNYLCEAISIPVFSDEGVFGEKPYKPEQKTTLADISSWQFEMSSAT
jgi:hypothetical protein